MSVITSFYDINFSVIRKVAGTGLNTRLMIDSSLSIGNSGVIRPITDISQLFDQNNYGKEYTLYCDEDVDIKVGDVILIGSNKYNVQGLSVFSDLEDDSDSHRRVRINKMNSNTDA